MGLQDKTLKISIRGNLGKYNTIWSEIEDKLFGSLAGGETLKWNEIEDELPRSYKIIWSEIEDKLFESLAETLKWNEIEDELMI